MRVGRCTDVGAVGVVVRAAVVATDAAGTVGEVAAVVVEHVVAVVMFAGVVCVLRW